MRIDGFLTPESAPAAHDAYEALAVPARDVTRAVVMAMDIEGDDYRQLVDESVTGAAQEAMFGSLLEVRTADREAFDHWCDRPDNAELTVTMEGSEHVANIAWHEAPSVDRVIAATYESQREAAVSTLRRLAWGRIYRDMVSDNESA